MAPDGPETVAASIREEIRRDGPMRFDRFMELALYAPGGYYDEPPVGTETGSDFATSPHVHPVFASLLADAIRDLHEAIGSPRPFDLLEAGAGDGTLLRGLMSELADLEPRVIAVERSLGARAALAGLTGVEVRATMPEATRPAVVLAHELLDNLPFRRLVVSPGPHEVHVGLDGDRFVEVLLPVEPPDQPGAPGDRPPEAPELVLQERAAAFLTAAVGGPAPRAVLAIDYGSDDGSGGPAHGYEGHRVVEDLLAAPGSTDITAGVDFGALARAVRTSGAAALPTVSQHDALVALGLEDWLRTQLERQRDLLRTGRGAEAVGVWGGRSRASLLADPAGLGRFRWFVATTPGVPEPDWLRAARRLSG